MAPEQRERFCAALIDLHSAVFASLPVPAHRTQGWGDLTEPFVHRLCAATLRNPARALDVADHSAKRLFDTLRGELDRMTRESVSDRELDLAKSYLIGSFPFRLDTSSKVADFLLAIESQGLGLDYAIMALAPTVGWLFVGRLLSGITASSFSTSFAYIAMKNATRAMATQKAATSASVQPGMIGCVMQAIGRISQSVRRLNQR